MLVAADLPLVPFLQHLRTDRGEFITKGMPTIGVSSNDAQGRFAASLLTQGLESIGAVEARIKTYASGWPRIVLA
jgi:hypothetical protein